MNDNIMLGFISLSNEDIDEAKYKIGDEVIFEHSVMGEGITTILGVADTGDGIEYAGEGLHLLLWEHEIVGSNI